MAQINIAGRIVAAKSHQGIRNLRVEAWDKDVKSSDLLGSSISDEKGRFRIEVDSKYSGKNTLDRNSQLFFKAYRGGELLVNTEQTPLSNVREDIFETIEVDIFEPNVLPRPEGKDLVTATQALKIAKFFKESDFSGLLKEYATKSGASLGFLSDMLINAITKFNFDTPANPSYEIYGQKTEAVKRQLDTDGIKVESIKPYAPRLDRSSYKAFSLFPPKLQSGQRVQLYEENGVVKYYSVVEERPSIGDKLPQNSDAALAAAVKDLEAMRQTLESNQTLITQKNQQIEALQLEINAIRNDQEEIKKILQSDAFAKFIKSTNAQSTTDKTVGVAKRKKSE